MKRHLIAIALLIVFAAVPRVALAMNTQEEIELGRKIDAQIMKDNKLYPDPSAQKEIEECGQKLAKFVKRPEIAYSFKILKDNEFNAFAVPGGYVYFTDRLWRVLRPEERAGVIAHEITHVDQRHAIDAISKQQKRQTILAILLAATKASDIWGNIAGIAETMYTLKYSRGDEQLADFGAVDLCEKANYNPAGILLAMYKIQRFESEAGGAPPKIFSAHPPTKERLDYLKQLLVNRGIPVPEEKIETFITPNRIGEVVSATDSVVTFRSGQTLKTGDVVWVMREGWDFYYEKRAAVPAARAVVTNPGNTQTANFWMIPSAKPVKITAGMGVYAPPLPDPRKGIGSLGSTTLQSAVGRLQLDKKPNALDRLFAVQPVWNKDNTQLVNNNVGYLVVTDPATETGYVGVQQSIYSYAPMQAGSVVVSVVDPDQSRWVGPVMSIGKGGGTVEVRTARQLDKNKTYEVLYPAWSDDLPYEKRVAGTARLESTAGKIVLKMVSYSAGWSISGIQNGFDVYESKPEPK